MTKPNRSWHRLERAAHLVRAHLEKMEKEEMKDNYEKLNSAARLLDDCTELNRLAMGASDEPDDKWEHGRPVPGEQWQRREESQFTEGRLIVEVVEIENRVDDTLVHFRRPGVELIQRRFLRNFMKSYEPYEESGD